MILPGLTILSMRRRKKELPRGEAYNGVEPQHESRRYVSDIGLAVREHGNGQRDQERQADRHGQKRQGVRTKITQTEGDGGRHQIERGGKPQVLMKSDAVQDLVGCNEGKDRDANGKSHGIGQKQHGNENTAEGDNAGQNAFQHGMYLSFR